MTHIWTFSPKSKELLEQCLNAALITDDSNKWLKQFGPKNTQTLKKMDKTVVIQDSPDVEMSVKQENEDQDIQNALEEFIDEDFDIISNFNILEDKCENNPTILTKLAENLALSNRNKLIQHVFDSESINKKFLDIFFEYFLPVYIKNDNSRSSTDLLLKTYKLFPQYMKLLLKVVLKDLEIQNNILNDFILMLNSNENTELLNKISSIELTGEEFTHSLFNLFTAYKSCNKTDSIQKYIVSLLKTHSQFCSIDKNYGKLLLAYLQQEKTLKHVLDKLVIERIVESHKSPFKRPCLAVLKELNYG